MMKAMASLFLMISLAAPASARQRSALAWGGDAERGAPYQMPDPRDPAKIIGFEVDIADALGKRLGMEPRFVQQQWDGLVPGLQRGEYDAVIAGLEITPERLEKISFSSPYYYSTLSLTVRLDETRIRAADDLSKRTVGTLKASLAERYLQELGVTEIRTYDNQAHPYIDLLLGRIDAVVMDTPIALYYAYGEQFHNVELPSSRFPIAIGIRKDDTKLLGAVNEALGQMRVDGTLKGIYQHWGLYNSSTADYFGDRNPVSNANADRYRDYLAAVQTQRTFREQLEQYLSFLPLLLRGALVTVEISISAMAVAICLGLFLAIVRVFGSRWVAWPAVAFIEVIRGTPLLIQLFIIFYGLPSLGVRLTPVWAAIFGLGLNYAAYEAENYRAGIQSIPRGQLDAALALGLTRLQTIWRIILPQAVRLVIPPVTNDFIALLKDSSLVSVITMVELTKVYGQLASTYYDYIGIGVLVAGIYFLMGLPIARLSRYVEGKLSYMKV
jgi:His/Glu/Gln/Arg/opine family amino acid ABC transporter permease subunit